MGRNGNWEGSLQFEYCLTFCRIHGQPHGHVRATADFTILVVNPLNKKTFKVQGIVQIPENITSTVPLATSITMGLEIGLLYN